MRGKVSLLIGIFLVAVSLVSVWFVFRPVPEPRFYASVTSALSADGQIEQYQRAMEKRDFHFPDDLGPHPGFQTEWWYYTGNLQDAKGRHFGYQLTIFRRALSGKKTAQENSSKWRTRQIYFAHFAISDIEDRKFYSFEKFSRGALGLAGALAEPYQVWVENWRIAEDGEYLLLRAAEGGISLDLNLSPEKPIVLQGDQGLSQKGTALGNASYYFSQTRISSSGTIKIAGKSFEVEGLSWLDREWSTSVLERGATGWDWFSIQLNDQTEMMVFQLRNQDATISPYSAGVFVTADGTSSTLKKDEFEIRTTSHWKSPHSGVTYPSGWEITVPRFKLSLRVSPLLSDQEHRHRFRYWEGAVEVKSEHASGFGYVELTGY